GGEPGKLCHHAHEADGRHAGDESIVLRHVSNLMTELANFRSNVLAQHAGRSCIRRVETEKGLKKSRLACAVRPKKADTASRICPGQALQNRTASERNAESIELNKLAHTVVITEYTGKKF